MQPIYLNTAATGLLPQEFTTEANKLYLSLANNASAYAEHWRDNQLPIVKQNIGKLINGPADNIAVLPNFSWGINGVVHSLKGDEKILLYAADYPSLLEPFRVNNFDITWVHDTDGFTIPIQELKAKLLSEKINILAISHVQWMTGYKIDLADIGTFCKQHDILFVVDATQSIGAIPIDISQYHVDVLIASTYKWLNAGFGTAFMYINNSFLQRYTPKVAGNNSYVLQDGKPVYIAGITSYEPGHPNMYGLTVLNAAITHRLKQTVAAVYQHNQHLTQKLIDGIANTNAEMIGEHSTDNRASIIFLKNTNNLLQKLQENNITVSLRGNIRISMHYYNALAEVEKLLAVVQQA